MYSFELSKNSLNIPLIHWKGPQKSSPVFHWAHATGFNAETYRTLLEPLSEKFNVYAWDLRGHGKSTANTSKIKVSEIYSTYSKDLGLVISRLSAKHQSKVFLGGHSIGGTLSISAALENQSLVSSLLLVDPVVFNWHTKYLMAVARLLKLNLPNAYLALNAKKRRDTWPNIDTLYKSYEGRGAFKTWTDGFLNSYLTAGTVEGEGSISLTCSPEWEAQNFIAFDSVNIVKSIKGLEIPTRLLLAKKGSTTKALSSFQKNNNSVHTVVENSTHFLPMEFPELVRTEIFELIKK